MNENMSELIQRETPKDFLPASINQIHDNSEYERVLYKNLSTNMIFECLGWGVVKEKYYLVCIDYKNDEYSFNDVYLIQQRTLHILDMVEKSNKYMFPSPVMFPDWRLTRTIKLEFVPDFRIALGDVQDDKE